MEELGRRFDAARPDVTVVLPPHNVHVESAMAVITAGSLYGELKEGGAGRGAFDPTAGSKSVSLRAVTDRELAQGCLGALRAAGIAAPGVHYGANDAAAAVMPMDWAVLVPLWFMGGRGDHPKPVVVMAPARG